jgi:hypothetical protein
MQYQWFGKEKPTAVIVAAANVGQAKATKTTRNIGSDIMQRQQLMLL